MSVDNQNTPAERDPSIEQERPSEDRNTEESQQPENEETPGPEQQDLTIGQPAKLMRIGTMIKQLLDEVKSSPLDEKARARLAQLHERSLNELKDGLSEDLADELSRLSLPLGDDEEEAPSEAELRVAQAQLVGWLEGLFHGLQAALVAQQMGAQQQLQQMRKGLPPGVSPQQAQAMAAQAQREQGESGQGGPGQYL